MNQVELVAGVCIDRELFWILMLPAGCFYFDCPQVTLTPSATFSSAAASIATIRLHNDAISAIVNQLPLLQTLAHADAAQARALLTEVPVLQAAVATAAGAAEEGEETVAQPAPRAAAAPTPAHASSACSSHSTGSDVQVRAVHCEATHIASVLV